MTTETYMIVLPFLLFSITIFLCKASSSLGTGQPLPRPKEIPLPRGPPGPAGPPGPPGLPGCHDCQPVSEKSDCDNCNPVPEKPLCKGCHSHQRCTEDTRCQSMTKFNIESRITQKDIDRGVFYIGTENDVENQQ